MSWTIGSVRVSKVVEHEFAVPFEDYLVGVPDDVVTRYPWLAPHFVSEDGRPRTSIHGLVIDTGELRILVDTGLGHMRPVMGTPGMPSDFLDKLTAAGYDAGDIDVVVCTHLHFDHVGWNTRLVSGRWVPTFPQARYLFGKQEFDHWSHLRDTGGYHNVEHLHDAVDPVVAAGLVDYIGTEHQLTDEVTLFPTPGHTPGHVSVLIRSRGEEAVITGDLMHHPIQLVAPLRHGNFDMDKAQGALTRQAFVERFANSKVMVIGSHFCDPTSGWIVRHGSGWKLRTG